jgi:hypothetical protein
LSIVGKADEAIVGYNDLIRRLDGAQEASLRGSLALALKYKGLALTTLGCLLEANAVYDDALLRFREDSDSELVRALAEIAELRRENEVI